MPTYTLNFGQNREVGIYNGFEIPATGGGGGSLLLDVYPDAAVAYSLRKLSSTYTGNIIKVRRSSDNTEQEFGFVDGALDTGSLSTFVGAGSGYVTVWYDQSGNNHHLTMPAVSQSYQPRIVNTGTLVTLNGKPAVSDATSGAVGLTTRFLQPSASIFPADPISIFAVLKNNSTTTTPAYSLEGSGVNYYFYATKLGSTAKTVSTAQTFSQRFAQYYRVNGAPETTLNDFANATVNDSALAIANQALVNIVGDEQDAATGDITDYFSFLSFGTRGFPYTNRVMNQTQEFIVWGDQTNNSSSIETSINDYYSIYP